MVSIATILSHRYLFRYTIVQYFYIFVTITIVYNVAKLERKSNL